MKKLRNVVVASLLAVGTVTLNPSSAFAETMTCTEAVDIILNRISTLQGSIFTGYSSQLGWEVSDPTWLSRVTLRDELVAAKRFYYQYPQCQTAADRAYYLETVKSVENWLDGVEDRY